MSDDCFLVRFLSSISAGEQPSLTDSRQVANALIQIHDYGISFKSAFGLTDKRGRKRKNLNEAAISDALISMSQGFLGNPIYLNSFLSKANQGLQQKSDNLQRVASALIKMRDGISFKLAFGIIEKTGNKKLDITAMPFSDIVSDYRWIIHYAYKKYRKFNTHEVACELVSDNILVNNRNTGYSTRRIESILAETKACADIYAMPIKIRQRKAWALYFANRKNIKEIDQCVLLELAGLYEEVVLKKRYALITRGTHDYPERLTALIEKELGPIYEIAWLT